MLPGDSEVSAKDKALIFNDPRVHQFYDPGQRSGRAIAAGLGYNGRVAWDIYLFYQAGDEWNEQPPAPVSWMHQISAGWADRRHFHTGADLVKEIYLSMEKLS